MSGGSPTTGSATSIEGVHLFSPARHGDDRGWFTRTLDLAWLDDLGLDPCFVQHNQSRSVHRVLRGLHVRGGVGENKLVRCARGAVVDHVVDLRPWSPSFLRTERFVLDDERSQHLYLPRFVAHGFQVVSDSADVCYLHSRAFGGEADLSIAWSDPGLALEWPVADPILSDRDAAAPPLAEIDLRSAFDR